MAPAEYRVAPAVTTGSLTGPFRRVPDGRLQGLWRSPSMVGWLAPGGFPVGRLWITLLVSGLHTKPRLPMQRASRTPKPDERSWTKSQPTSSTGTGPDHLPCWCLEPFGRDAEGKGSHGRRLGGAATRQASPPDPELVAVGAVGLVGSGLISCNEWVQRESWASLAFCCPGPWSDQGTQLGRYAADWSVFGSWGVRGEAVP